MDQEGALSDFERSTVGCARQAALSVSVTADLLRFPCIISRFDREWSDLMVIIWYELLSTVDGSDQMMIARLVWADSCDK